jgi:hypothetical protein
MADDFTYDVFLSHSSKDEAVVRTIAERLQADGLLVWFENWETKLLTTKTHRAGKIEEGLERSRVLVLCMSANAFGPDWVQLEAGTFRFRDPLNKERRFIPLRLDEAPIKDSLEQFIYLDWRTEDRKQEYAKLLEACRPQAKQQSVETQAGREQVTERAIQLDFKADICAYAFGPDGKSALTGCQDNTVRLWDVETGRCLQVLEGHRNCVFSVAWSVDHLKALSGSGDNTVRLWDMDSGCCLRVLGGHTGHVMSVAFSADGHYALSGGMGYRSISRPLRSPRRYCEVVGHEDGTLPERAPRPHGRCQKCGMWCRWPLRPLRSAGQDSAVVELGDGALPARA